MDPIHWSTHVKHIAIALIAFAGICGIFAIRGKYEAMVADRMAKRDEQIAANQANVKTAQQTIVQTDAATKDKVNAIQARLATTPTTEQVRAIVESSLQGVKTVTATDSQGKSVIAIEDTPENRQAINKAQVDYQTCQFNLEGCAAARKQLEGIVATDESTIKLQEKQMADMRKFMVPRWTAMFGVGKSQGTNFQDVNSYQPAMGLNYRFSKQFGVWGMVQNKSAAGGISWNFGGVPK